MFRESRHILAYILPKYVPSIKAGGSTSFFYNYQKEEDAICFNFIVHSYQILFKIHIITQIFDRSVREAQIQAPNHMVSYRNSFECSTNTLGSNQPCPGLRFWKEKKATLL
jgi:hypothetical protein